jgi:hypothetical protein
MFTGVTIENGHTLNNGYALNFALSMFVGKYEKETDAEIRRWSLLWSVITPCDSKSEPLQSMKYLARQKVSLLFDSVF